jgi:hypothetical protein
MFVALALAAALQLPTQDQTCAYDREALLALSPDALDQNLDGGWRPLAGKQQRRGEAAELLAAYRSANRQSLTAGQLHINYWHEGQIRASLGERVPAIRLLLAGVNPEVQGDGFQDYALGTVAFLNNDRPGLQAARDRLALTPKPEDWDQTAASFRQRFGVDMQWPINLNVLDAMIACFGRSYDEAYAGCKTP